MHKITYFTTPPSTSELPPLFSSPFADTPHPIAIKACLMLQTILKTSFLVSHEVNFREAGKMFGVLVVKDAGAKIGFLSAFSGKLENQWYLPMFVPPIFDQDDLNKFLPQGEKQLKNYANNINTRLHSQEYINLQIELKSLNREKNTELARLNQAHKIQKLERHKKRSYINALSETEQQTLLNKLSTESQQDRHDRKSMRSHWQERISTVKQNLDTIDTHVHQLKKSRTLLSQKLQSKVFATYVLHNSLGEQISITELLTNQAISGGTGDCAAPKLLQYAIKHKLKPLAIAEFWWGAPPPNGIRHHRHYYPACRGKCHPILPFMLKGLNSEPSKLYGNSFADPTAPDTVYEDESVVVINKPNGLLSIPGKDVHDSVLTRLRTRYPDATGPLLVHRLDLDTSGLLLVAKTSETHKALQKQFIQRKIEKRYVAILSKPLSQSLYNPANSQKGTVQLPLRVDIDDRPRQIVCHLHGKKSKTHWETIVETEQTTRVYLYPISGRTHQLRVHAAHSNGLNAAIIGDNLYGVKSDRLYLHAERLCFRHPKTGLKIETEALAPF